MNFLYRSIVYNMSLFPNTRSEVVPLTSEPSSSSNSPKKSFFSIPSIPSLRKRVLHRPSPDDKMKKFDAYINKELEQFNKDTLPIKVCAVITFEDNGWTTTLTPDEGDEKDIQTYLEGKMTHEISALHAGRFTGAGKKTRTGKRRKRGKSRRRGKRS